jgi:DNA repair exonuclease SbcCD nuclease subunit
MTEKFVILGDCHMGVRNDSEKLYQNQELFYSKVFWPYIEEHNIKKIIQTGDLFDSRIKVNTRTLQFSKRILFDVAKKRGITIHSIAGNHDAYYKDSLKIVTGQQVLKDYTNVHIYSKPTEISIGGIKISMIPWICKENETEILDYIKDDENRFCVGHFELALFRYSKSSVAQHGLDSAILKNYEMVFSGHYHSKSVKDNIIYVGTPTENTWEDYDDGKGFWILDTETEKPEFIPNPYNLFEAYHATSSDDIKALKKTTGLDNKFIKLFVDYEATDKEINSLVEKWNEQAIHDLVVIKTTDQVTENGVVSTKDLATNRELIDKYCEENSVPTPARNMLLELYDGAMVKFSGNR